MSRLSLYKVIWISNSVRDEIFRSEKNWKKVSLGLSFAKNVATQSRTLSTVTIDRNLCLFSVKIFGLPTKLHCTLVCLMKAKD